jgi:hypothetical protein
MSEPFQQTLSSPTEESFYLDYFQKIEAHFASLRDRSLLLSPADYQLAERWFTEGVPLSCVLRGLNKAYLKCLERCRQGEGVEIRSLGYCSWAVEEEWRSYRQALPEERAEAGESDELSAEETAAVLDGLLFDLERALDAVKKRGPAALAEALASICDDLKSLAAQAERLEIGLCSLDDRMMEVVSLNVPLPLAESIAASVDKRLSKSAGNMDAPTLAATRNKGIQAALRREFSLPKLTLYSL